MIDVCLSGNIFYDIICETKGFPIENHSNEIYTSFNIGGIDNLRRIISKTKKVYCHTTIGNDNFGKNILKEYKKYDVTIIKGSTSHAIIISDIYNNKRTSLVDWGVGFIYNIKKMKKCKWHHVCYVDALFNFDEKIAKSIKDKSEILTVDFCLNKHSIERDRIIKSLKYVDGIIASDAELNSFFQENDNIKCVAEATKYVKFCILHTPTYSLFCDSKKIVIEHKVTPINKPMNVLGAGDVFCSYVIINKLNGLDFNESIKNAHIETGKYLERNFNV